MSEIMVIAVVFVLVDLVVLAIVWVRRRRRNERWQNEDQVTPL